MLNTAFVRSNALTVGFTAFVSIGSLLATASSTLAATVDFGTWGRLGDAVFTPPPPPGGQQDMQSGYNPWFSNLVPGTAPGTISNSPAVSIADLNTFLGSALTGTTASAVEGDIKGIQAGDVFKFSYAFENGTGATNDYAFLTVNGALISQFALSSQATDPITNPSKTGFFTGLKDGTFEYTFTAPGTYTIGLGVVSANPTGPGGTLGSGLGVANGNVQVVPTPAPLLGVIGMGAAQAVKRMRKKQEA